MSRILCAWELGSGYGHVESLATVLQALAERGHELHLAARNLPRAARALAGLPVHLLQAPLWLEPTSTGAAACYPELLERVGYAQRTDIESLVRAWRSLYSLTEPDLVLAEHSPSAMLATRLDGIDTVAVGTGFTLPPLAAPMPTIAPGTAVSSRRMASAERRVLGRINAILGGAGRAPLGCCAELLAARARVLWTLPELDHYAHREHDEFHGPLKSAPRMPPPWPPGAGPRVFGYYHASYPELPAVAQGLRTLGHVSVLVVGGATEESVSSLASASLRVTQEPVDLEQASAAAGLVVSHGGHGSVSTCLLQGCPQLMLPHFVEQRMLAFRLRERGYADFMPSPLQAVELAGRARQMLADAAYGTRAGELARRYRGRDTGAAVKRIVAACEDAA
jgi:UDP:flavonoid glycosyltransferase YjiC (YdhE family)